MRCIVTGGTGRLGRAIVEGLVGHGARVGFTFHANETGARDLSARVHAPARRVDLTDTSAIEPALHALADELGGVDAFVHAAGLSSTVEPARFDALTDVLDAGWDRLMAVNVKAAFFATRALVERFDGGGNVVFVGSVGGVKSLPTPAPYAASKAALSGLARALAKELGPKNVRVNVVAPGLLEAGSSDHVPSDLRAEYLKHAALKRIGTLAEAAEVVVELALRNTYVTGRTISVDGGL
jgi:NAD(P)-dependent dehydrogenase (short-subunit alcohol dehydrogenase family)